MRLPNPAEFVPQKENNEMLKPTMRKLYGKLLTLGILAACLWFFTTSRPAYAFASCESCSENFYYASYQCDIGNWPVSSSWEDCMREARATRDSCLNWCDFAGPGGGGGAGSQSRTKTPCMQACHAARSECRTNQGIPDVEDCLATGESAIFCCHQAFSDCMSNCP
jgi:hypothetical protein